jgi:hypothetical protein
MVSLKTLSPNRKTALPREILTTLAIPEYLFTADSGAGVVPHFCSLSFTILCYSPEYFSAVRVKASKYND